MAISTAGQPAPHEGGEFATYLDARGAPQITVPGGDMLLFADYVRDGDDLVLTGPDGDTVVVLDYFAGGTPPALATEGGSVIAPDLALALAGETPPVQLAQASGGGGAQAIGQVITATGNITAARAGGGDDALDAGDPVFKGDVLQTGPDGTLEVEFEDGSKLKLSSNARMVVDDLVYDPGADQGSALFSLVQGTFGFESGEIAKAGPDAIQIRTPVATIGIRGTVLLINVDQNGDVLSITVVGDSGSIALIDPATGDVIGTLTGTTDGSQPNTITFLPGEDGPTYSFIAPQDLGDTYGMQGVEQAAALLDTEAGPQDDGDGQGDGDTVQIVVVDPQGNFTVVDLDDLGPLTDGGGNPLDFQFGNGGDLFDDPNEDGNLFGGDEPGTPPGDTGTTFNYTLGAGDASFSGGSGFDVLALGGAPSGGPYTFSVGQNAGDVVINQFDGSGNLIATITTTGIEEIALTLGTSGDTVEVGALGDTDIADDTIILEGLAGDDTLDASGTDKRVVIEGGDGDDIMYGGSAGDDLDGGAGDDFADGGLGDDVLTDTGGNDTLVGGRGDDTLTASGPGGGGELGDVLIGDAVTNAQAAETALNLAFAIDVSGSMSATVGDNNENRLKLAVQAIKGFMEDLRAEGLPESTAIYLIPFSSSVSNATEFSLGDEAGIDTFLDGLTAGGGTTFVNPLEEASAWLQEDAEGRDPDHVDYDPLSARFVDHTNRVYFLSDGQDPGFEFSLDNPSDLLSALYGINGVAQIPALEVEAFGFGAQGVNVDQLDLVETGDPDADPNQGEADFAVVVNDDPDLLTDAFDAGSIVEEVPGSDTITGGATNDLIFGDVPALSTQDKLIYDDPLQDFDFFDFAFTKLVDLQGFLGEGNEGFDPTLFALTNSVGEDDIIDGGAGSDIIFGQGGNDTIFGGPASSFDSIGFAGGPFLGEGGIGEFAANLIYGGDGDDTIFGGDDLNLIFGGNGADTILGGGGSLNLVFGEAGDDTFVFGSPSDGMSFANEGETPVGGGGFSFIGDFESGSDKIELGEGFGSLSGIGALTDGDNFRVLNVEYDGLNAGTQGNDTAWDNGEDTLLLDSAGNLIYDPNGASEGYTILANVGDASVAATDVSAPAAAGA